MEMSKQQPRDVVKEVAVSCIVIILMTVVTYFLTIWSR